VQIKQKSAKIKTLMADETFQMVIKEIMEQQVAVFINVHSTTDERDEAHDMVRVLGKIEDYFDSVISDEAIYNRKQKRKK